MLPRAENIQNRFYWGFNVSKIFRIFLMLSSLGLTFAVFLANKEINILNNFGSIFEKIPVISYFLYAFLACGPAALSLYLARKLSKDNISKNSIVSIELANDTYLPVYLGYFFVALSVQEYSAFCFVFGIIFTLTFCSKAQYFNPLYFMYGYNFYNATTDQNVSILLITKKDLRNPADIEFSSIHRVNNLTFIDV